MNLKQGVTVSTGFIWPRIRSSEQSNELSDQINGEEFLLSSQKELCPVELVQLVMDVQIKDGTYPAKLYPESGALNGYSRYRVKYRKHQASSVCRRSNRFICKPPEPLLSVSIYRYTSTAYIVFPITENLLDQVYKLQITINVIKCLVCNHDTEVKET